jgi:alpha-tubulin suppressor-like RCC1 family protein
MDCLVLRDMLLLPYQVTALPLHGDIGSSMNTIIASCHMFLFCSDYGGDFTSVENQLKSGVFSIASSGRAFAVLKIDGSVVSFGYAPSGDSSAVVFNNPIVKLASTYDAFAALSTAQSVVAWGSSAYGGSTSAVASQLTSGVLAIYSNYYAFAVIKTDGSVVAWGDTSKGGQINSNTQAKLTQVRNIYSTYYAFAALTSTGAVVTWGDSSKYHAHCPTAQSLILLLLLYNRFWR